MGVTEDVKAKINEFNKRNGLPTGPSYAEQDEKRMIRQYEENHPDEKEREESDLSPCGYMFYKTFGPF